MSQQEQKYINKSTNKWTKEGSNGYGKQCKQQLNARANTQDQLKKMCYITESTLSCSGKWMRKWP